MADACKMARLGVHDCEAAHILYHVLSVLECGISYYQQDFTYITRAVMMAVLEK